MGAISGLTTYAILRSKPTGKEKVAIPPERDSTVADRQSALVIAEYRQNWLSELRDLMARYVSLAIAHGLEANYLETDTRLPKDRFAEIVYLGTKIQMMINPSDPHYEELNELIQRITHSVGENSGKRSDFEFFADLDTTWLMLCQRMLKREWEILKTEVYGMHRPDQKRLTSLNRADNERLNLDFPSGGEQRV
jgi:hypothetical protein